MKRLIRCAWGALAVGFTVVAAGCGTPGAPQPPSLNLPERVTDLAAVRTGDQVALSWTMPQRNTDKLLLKGAVSGSICRQEGNGACLPMGEVRLAPGAKGTFSEPLPAKLSEGSARALSYFVELKNNRNHSAGKSNAAPILAGTVPDPVAGLTAEPHRDGIVLHWAPEHPGGQIAGQVADRAKVSEGSAIRLHRTLVSAAPETQPKAQTAPLAAPAEPIERNLLVERGARGDAGRAVDRDIHFGQTYEYRAQRILRIQAGGQMLELAGALSGPVRIEARDIFPPSVPTGLAAVATMPAAASSANEADRGESGPSVDLSWQPDEDANLAGYVVYRREGEGEWKRISAAQPLAVPAFRDAHVLAGHIYHYAVSAVSEGNYESVLSIETQETVPAQE